MSLLSWLFPRAKRLPVPPAAPTATPVRSAGAAPNARPAPAAGPGSGPPGDERMQRREQLYAVVRDVMVRVGVLSAGYKFKVLSLDTRGSQFLVMVDTAPEYAGEPLRGVEIETMIMQTARSRCDLLVTAVYWRINAQLGMQLPRRPAGAPASQPLVAPTPRGAAVVRPGADAAPSRPAPLVQAPAASAPARFEPIGADEVSAFRQALADAADTRAGALEARQRGAQALPRPTGFEDTLMPGEDVRKTDLGSTQYGDL